MGGSRLFRLLVLGWIGTLAVLELQPPMARSACCYFSARETDIQQPSQKVFITWDPERHTESFTVQPRFEGNAKDFGMVIPTPGKPRLHEMPRDFFKELAVFTLLKNREYPQSKLMPFGGLALGALGGFGGLCGGMFGVAGGGMGLSPTLPRPTVQVLQTGVVGSLDYKVMRADRADDLYRWLKDNSYRYSGDEATLDFYVKKRWFFTVMKIDTMQMKRNKDGTFSGDVTPTRFQFTSDKLVYPLKITQLSVRDRTEALFYVQAPYKVDLPGDLTYQFLWVPMLQNARGWYQKGTFGRNELPGRADNWLKAVNDHISGLLDRGDKIGFSFVSGQRPKPNKEGHTPTSLEWAGRLQPEDLLVLTGEAPYSEKVPDVDQGFTARDFENPRKAAAVSAVISRRLALLRKLRPGGYLVRDAPAEDVKQLRLLGGHLQAGQFLTKFRKVFAKDEMDRELLIERAKLGQVEDLSKYEEILPTSPP